jgi:hypothetical protein
MINNFAITLKKLSLKYLLLIKNYLILFCKFFQIHIFYKIMEILQYLKIFIDFHKNYYDI